MFSRSPAPSAADVDDAHLEVTVTPSASAFYAGEVFSAVITLRNTRVPVYTHGGGSQPVSPNPAHLHLLPGTSTPLSSSGGSVTPTSPDRGWSPASPGGVGWRGEHARRPSGGKGHSRRAQSLALGKAISSQEMVWALGGEGPPPPLPPRRTPGIPRSHPHARQTSIASTAAFADSPPLPLAPLPIMPSKSEPVTPDPARQAPPIITAPEAGPSKPTSSRPTPSASPSLPDVQEEPRSPPSRSLNGTPSTSPPLPSPIESIQRSSSPRSRPAHSRAPSYHNAYGTSLLSPPPSHPNARVRPLHTGTTTVLWAHTRLVAHFHPSTQYIPPDPLLPLRARLLHQPIGSGSLSPSDAERGSRWSLSFGTGSIGGSTQPSLTGSLFGLAKGLVMGGTGGSLEEERRRVWSSQNLPVLDTARSLLGVDIKLTEGETREFVYTFKLPTQLPPAFKGRAVRFNYELLVSLNISLAGGGKRQRTKEISIPVRVWPNVSLKRPLRTYDVLQPIIQTAEVGNVVERPLTAPSTPLARRHMIEPESSDSLEAYAKRLLDTLHDPRRVPPSPSKALVPLRPMDGMSVKSPKSPSFLLPESRAPPRPRASSIVAGDDELVDEPHRCGEAVEILSRHSPKSSYDIRQDGEVVAVLTLVKTTYRLGETVLGVVTFNASPDHRVLKLNAYLETHEVIPDPLLPPNANRTTARPPELRKLHAEYRAAYAQFSERTAFSLDIPSDATPAFGLTAGADKGKGGLEWRVRLVFLVACPRRAKGHRRSGSGPAREGGRRILGVQGEEEKGEKASCLHLVPVEGDTDNTPYTASPQLAPFLSRGKEWAEARAETVECEVPVQVLAGNTAFVVRPSVFTV